MRYLRPLLEGKHILVQLLALLILIFVGMTVFSTLGQLVAYAIFHTMDMHTASNPAAYIRITQFFSSIGTFLCPALLFSYLQDGRWLNYNAANRRPHHLFVNTVLVLSIALLPLVAILEQWNEGMHLPEWMSGVEQWMARMEESMSKVMELLVQDHSYATLCLNILVMALNPAICEEFLFRGTLQSLLTKQWNKPHLAIWTTAVVFSAIHLQFYGFLPRMLLGAYLGYLFYWSRSLWLPVLAHFLHNALSILVSYTFMGRGIDIDDMRFTDIHGSTTLVFSCAVVAAMGIVFMWRTQKELK